MLWTVAVAQHMVFTPKSEEKSINPEKGAVVIKDSLSPWGLVLSWVEKRVTNTEKDKTIINNVMLNIHTNSPEFCTERHWEQQQHGGDGE